mmetsp:Transcript_82171/g.183545  ORF Transcript_82171/g.183545 Transcript_82171/m.183545 type:complete len:385 (-) Transcript_82171:159-1313(-)
MPADAELDDSPSKGSYSSEAGSDSEDERIAPLPLGAQSGAPRTLASEAVDIDKRERANEQVVQMAREYRAELGRRFALQKESSTSTDGAVRTDLEIMAEACLAELGPYLPAPSASSGASASAGGSGSRASPGGVGLDNTIIIFDWDDTLLPTWFLQDQVTPSLPLNAREAAVPKDSPFYELLASHASIVKAMLTLARAVGQVAIVTLALRPWVLTSAERFLPGLGLPELLSRLGIPIYYAREHVKRPDACLAQVEEGVAIFTVAKRATMMKCLRKLSRKRKHSRMNVISIGDSLAEKDAIKEVLWNMCEQPGSEGISASPVCKTVKFVYQPTAVQLGDELQLLAMWLRQMASHREDFDINMEDPEDLRVRGHSFADSPAAAPSE